MFNVLFTTLFTAVRVASPHNTLNLLLQDRVLLKQLIKILCLYKRALNVSQFPANKTWTRCSCS